MRRPRGVFSCVKIKRERTRQRQQGKAASGQAKAAGHTERETRTASIKGKALNVRAAAAGDFEKFLSRSKMEKASGEDNAARRLSMPIIKKIWQVKAGRHGSSYIPAFALPGVSICAVEPHHAMRVRT